jgi:hypothetical protein
LGPEFGAHTPSLPHGWCGRPLQAHDFRAARPPWLGKAAGCAKKWQIAPLWGALRGLNCTHMEGIKASMWKGFSGPARLILPSADLNFSACPANFLHLHFLAAFVIFLGAR